MVSPRVRQGNEDEVEVVAGIRRRHRLKKIRKILAETNGREESEGQEQAKPAFMPGDE
jgi:hypothetical protein